MSRFETPLGAVINLRHFNLGGDPETPGVLLILTMSDPSDPRRAEVFLDQDTATAVGMALTHGEF